MNGEDAATNRQNMEQVDKTGPSDGEQYHHSAESIYNLIKAKQWLESQVMELKTQYAMVESCHKKYADSGDPAKIQDHIGELQSELQEASGNAALKRIILSRLQHGEVLLHYLFPARASGDTRQITHDQQEKHTLVSDMVMKQTQLASNIARIHQKNQVKEQTLNALKAKSLGLKQNVRELMHHLLRARENQNQEQMDQEGEQVTRGREKLCHIGKKTELVRHLFQALILGSGINWAKDERLTELFLGLGRSLQDST